MFILSHNSSSFGINNVLYQRGELTVKTDDNTQTLYLYPENAGRNFIAHWSEFYQSNGNPFTSYVALVTYVRDNFFFLGSGGISDLTFRVNNNALEFKTSAAATTYTHAIDIVKLGPAKMTYVSRLALTGLTNGTIVFQTDGATGLYEYSNGHWHFIGTKTRKTISVSSYILQPQDIGYILEFTLDIPGVDVEVFVMKDMFTDGDIIDLVQLKSSKIKVIADIGMTVNSSSIYAYKRTYTQYAEAKIRFRSATEAILTGGLE